MMNTTKAKLVASLLFASCAVALPAASFYANQPKPIVVARLDSLPELPRLAESTVRGPTVTVLDEVKITASPRVQAPRAVSKKQECHLQRLEQGGSPEHPFVLVCG